MIRSFAEILGQSCMLSSVLKIVHTNFTSKMDCKIYKLFNVQMYGGPLAERRSDLCWMIWPSAQFAFMYFRSKIPHVHYSLQDLVKLRHC